MKKITLLLSFVLSVVTADITAASKSSHQLDPVTGDGVAAWELYDYSVGPWGNYVIHASVFDSGSGTWSAPVIISDPGIASHAPKLATNANGSIAAIWEGNDPINGIWHLCGATYDTGTSTWNAPTVLSSTSESLLSHEDYFVKLSAADEISVVYVSSNLLTFTEQLRGVFSPTYGTWNLPAVNIDP